MGNNNSKSAFFNHKSLFLSFCTNYILLLILTISIGTYAYNESLKIVEKNAIDAGLASLNQTKEVMDTRFREIESIVTQLAIDARVLGILNIRKPLTGSDHYKILELSEKIPAYNFTNEFIHDTYIYYDSDIFISSSFSTSEMKNYYDTRFKYHDMNYDDWSERIFNSNQSSFYWEANPVKMLNNERKYITYIKPIPLGTYRNYKSAIIVLINENEILKGWEYVNVSDSSWYYIADKNGDIISSRNFNDTQSNIENNTKLNDFSEIEVDGEKMIILSTISAVNGWQYVAAIPANYLTGKVEYIRRTYMLTLLIALAIGLLMAIFLSYRNSLPIIKIINKIKMKNDKLSLKTEKPYDYLEETISNLFENNDELRNNVEKQIEITKTALFERLIKGGFNQVSDIADIQTHIGLNFKENSFILLLIKINNYENQLFVDSLNKMDIARVLISREAEKLIKDENKAYNVDNDKIAVIVGFDNSRKDFMIELKDNLIYLSSKFTGLYNIDISIAVGNEYHSLTNLKDSYDEAVNLLENYLAENNNKICFYRDIFKNANDYYYPMDVELKLIGLVKMGAVSESVALVEFIYKKNSSENPLSVNMIRLLVNEIIGTFIKIKKHITISDCENTEIDLMINRLKESKSLEEIFSLFAKTTEYLSNVANNKKKSHNLQLKENIIELVHSDYHDDNFCITNLAAKVNLSEKYLTNFFKEQLGESFQNYLEKIRMEKAVWLMKQTELTIAEIAIETGYSNVNTFYKAFKRYSGVSPSTFRTNSQ